MAPQQYMTRACFKNCFVSGHDPPRPIVPKYTRRSEGFEPLLEVDSGATVIFLKQAPGRTPPTGKLRGGRHTRALRYLCFCATATAMFLVKSHGVLDPVTVLDWSLLKIVRRLEVIFCKRTGLAEGRRDMGLANRRE